LGIGDRKGKQLRAQCKNDVPQHCLKSPGLPRRQGEKESGNYIAITRGKGGPCDWCPSYGRRGGTRRETSSDDPIHWDDRGDNRDKEETEKIVGFEFISSENSRLKFPETNVGEHKS